MLSGNGDLSSDRVVDIAEMAEAKGFDGLWFGETTLRDASVLATIAACRTKKIGIGTSILNVFTRSPSALALLGVTLNEFSGGRFTLGLGVSTAAIVQNWHGIPYSQPVERLEETVALLRKYFSGERFTFDGKFSSPRNARLKTTRPPRIALAALNDRMVDRAARLGDRVILNFYPPDRIAHARELIESVGKAPTLSVMLYAYVLGDDERGEDAAKELISFYSSAQPYSTLFSKAGFQSEAKGMRKAWNSKDKASVKKHVTRTMIEKMMVVGRMPQLRERVKSYIENGVDDVFVCPSPFGDYEGNIEEIMKHLR
jgi:probable F420-dependent oxidoreductase